MTAPSKTHATTLLLFFVFVFLSFAFGVMGNLIAWKKPQVFMLLAIESIIALILLFSWYVRDTNKLGIQRTATFSLAILVFTIIAVPIHLFKTRDKTTAVLYISIFISFVLLGILAKISGAELSGLITKDNQVKEVVSPEPKTERMKLIQYHYKTTIDAKQRPYLYVDATKKGVLVPLTFVQDGKIVLDISPVAIEDFEWHADRIEFDAAFSGSVSHLIIPLDSIIALYSKETKDGIVFKD